MTWRALVFCLIAALDAVLIAALVTAAVWFYDLVQSRREEDDA